MTAINPDNNALLFIGSLLGFQDLGVKLLLSESAELF
jgi:hypothetical protein